MEINEVIVTAKQIVEAANTGDIVALAEVPAGARILKTGRTPEGDYFVRYEVPQ